MPVLRTSRQKVILWLFGAPALLPVIFMAPSLLTLNGRVAHQSGNDVLGTGGALLMFTMLAVTPLRRLTGQQWFVPLRRWYGVIFAFDIFLDAIAASNDTAFNGGPVAELAGHSFLLMGLAMTLLLIPLCIMGIWNKRTFRQLGRYWKPVQQYGTYAVWSILGLHLMLLEGFGLGHGERFPLGLLHQRFYEYLGCSALMVTLRLAPVRSWVRDRRTAGRAWQAWLALAPLMLVFLVAYIYFVNELMFKGLAAVSLTSVSD